ncbi:MAG: hypothetical protein GY859_03730, partial [Desulfobacterales bacterium]|nr:hypothetical protein [Desulfobacterales bacterium]
MTDKSTTAPKSENDQMPGAPGVQGADPGTVMNESAVNSAVAAENNPSERTDPGVNAPGGNAAGANATGVVASEAPGVATAAFPPENEGAVGGAPDAPVNEVLPEKAILETGRGAEAAERANVGALESDGPPVLAEASENTPDVPREIEASPGDVGRPVMAEWSINWSGAAPPEPSFSAEKEVEGGADPVEFDPPAETATAEEAAGVAPENEASAEGSGSSVPSLFENEKVVVVNEPPVETAPAKEAAEVASENETTTDVSGSSVPSVPFENETVVVVNEPPAETAPAEEAAEVASENETTADVSGSSVPSVPSENETVAVVNEPPAETATVENAAGVASENETTTDVSGSSVPSVPFENETVVVVNEPPAETAPAEEAA